MARKKKSAEAPTLIGEFPAVRLKAPKHASSACVDGEEYAVEDGYVIVPAAAAEALKSHGYLDEDEDEEEEAE